ncbi:MAG: HEAT repeat domain-containing protein [Deltaproteobacteria bacterium]|nr:HEAT repeat domain-containing protein [Deltaproteobacteria bacterium]
MAAAGAGLAGLGAVAALWPNDPSASARIEAETAVAERAARSDFARAVAKVHGGLAGTRLMAGRHGLVYRMSMEAPDPSGRMSAAELRLEGELSLAGAREDGWRVGRLNVGKLDADPRMHALLGVEQQAPAAEFGEVFALKVDEDGAISELRHDPTASVGTRNLVSGLMHAVQIVQTPDDVGQAAWSLREPDTDGEVEASYALSEGKITKRWERSSLGGAGAAHEGNGDIQLSAKGTATLLLQGEGAAMQVSSAEHALDVEADLGMGGAELRYRGEVRASLNRLGDVSALWALTVDVNGMEKGLGATKLRAPRPRIEVAEGATVYGLAMAASAAGKDKGQLRRQIRQQLSVLIARDPAHAKETAEMLRRGGADVDRRTLIEALAASDSPAAKAEMASIIDDDSLDGDLRADVATGTTFMPRPGSKLLASLETQSQHAGASRIATSALWALAAQADLQQKYDAALAERLQADVLKRSEAVLGATGEKLLAEHAAKMGEAPPVADKVDPDTLPDDPPAAADPLAARPGVEATSQQAQAFLDALGNLGSPKAFKLIRPWTYHPNHQVRMTAAMALRSVQTSEARTLIIDIMARDSDGWVRRAAVMAAAYHPPAVMADPVKRALKEDAHANVRLAAAYNLAFWSYQNPKMITYVREAAEREPKPFVARAMRDLEPMLFRDTEGGAVTMEPMLHGGKHIPSVPEGVIEVARQAEKTAATPEGALVGKPVHNNAAGAAEEAP